MDSFPGQALTVSIPGQIDSKMDYLSHRPLKRSLHCWSNEINSISELLNHTDPWNMLHIRNLGMTWGGSPSFSGTDVIGLLGVASSLHSPLSSDTGRKEQIGGNCLIYFPPFLCPLHPNQWLTWVCTILNYVNSSKIR